MLKMINSLCMLHSLNHHSKDNDPLMDSKYQLLPDVKEFQQKMTYMPSERWDNMSSYYS